MSNCPSCGAPISASSAACEYCGAAVSGRKVLEVAWSARSGSGASGEGLVRVEAPAGAGAEQLRALVQSAFASAVEATGSGAGQEAVAGALQERLSGLLPQGQVLVELRLDAFRAFVPVAGKAGPAAGPAQGGGGCGGSKGAACGILMLSLCLMGSAGTCLFGSVLKAGQIEVVEQAKVVTVEEALETNGLLCVEATVAEVASALVIPGTDLHCIHYQETRTRTITTTETRNGRTSTRTRTETEKPETFTVRAFRLGSLEVRPQAGIGFEGTEFSGLETFPQREVGDEVRRTKGLRVGTPVTAVGTVTDGVMAGTPVTVISTLPSHAALLSSMKSERTAMLVFSLVVLGVGGLMLLASLAAFLRRR